MSFKRFIKPTIIVVVGLLLLLIYYFVDPVGSELARFMPKCPVKMLTGYDCPSCGIQRALYALLHGDFKAAFLINPFLALVLPYVALLLYTTLSNDNFAQKIKPYVQHRIVVYIYLAIYVIWWVLRNTKWWMEQLSDWL